MSREQQLNKLGAWHHKTEKRLANAFSSIRRRAFGYNSKNTCSAVSVALALNYLALEREEAFVPEAWLAERLDKGLPESAASLDRLYPQAGKLSRYLIEKCGMGGASFATRITWAFNKYSKKMLASGKRVRLKWTLFPRMATIRRIIEANFPVLITTTVAKTFSWHTMLVYGYRESYGKAELLVHSGWYSAANNDHYSFEGKDRFFQKEIWLDKRLAVFGYFFSFFHIYRDKKNGYLIYSGNRLDGAAGGI